jgi:endonuclease/exonuclease/phosphatase family metal-dependent hydrolase
MSRFEKSIDALRVFTLNAWFRPPLEERQREIAIWIDTVQPHIVCLQEVREIPGAPTLADTLAEECSGEWSVAFGGHVDGENLLSGNAVMSRWPIEASETFRLECADSRPKTLLWATTRGVNVFNVHLTADPEGAFVREKQAVFIDDLIRSKDAAASEFPVVLAGDFNATPGSNVIRFLRGEASLGERSTFYQDAWAVAGDGPGFTWHHGNPNAPPAYLFNARCDYIFVGLPKVSVGWSRNETPAVIPVGQVVRAYVVCDSSITGTFASDHYGVVADIQWENVKL